ncbi:nucleotidyltransferase family protein [bacterium]|nr:nucleotidyltransferase family protein [bacterium]
MKANELSKICVLPTATLRQAMECLNLNCKGIVLVVDEGRRLAGIITDGDLRRAFLGGHGVDSPVSQILKQKSDLIPKSVVAKLGTAPTKLLQMMQELQIRHIPIIDSSECVVDLALLEDFIPTESLPLQAVIMAGGQGKRLLPLTENTPKPMLPVGGRPLMEHMIVQLGQTGIRNVNISTNYLSSQISDYFGDGEKFGVKLSYVTEDKPLGTAGSLGLLGPSEEPLLVINGDILTKVDFRAMLSYHVENRADLTVAVRQYDLTIPYGLIECDGNRVTEVREKPAFKFLVNAGIYLLEPSVLKEIPVQGEHCDMTDLVQILIQKNKNVVSFPVVEYWLDIGQVADYQRAQEDMKQHASTVSDYPL